MLARLASQLAEELEVLGQEEKTLADRHERLWSFTRPSSTQLLLASDEAGLAGSLLK